MKTKFSLGLAVQYGLAIFFMLLFSLPLLFMISSSFKDPQAIFGDVKSW
jgi:ABC-type glycerol-3-phosphate transport system permease component